MRVFNITDIYGDKLLRKSLAAVSFTFGGVTIAPGESAVVPNCVKHEVNHFVLRGALTVDKLPEWYIQAKESIANAIKITVEVPVEQIEIRGTVEAEELEEPAEEPAEEQDKPKKTKKKKKRR